MALTALNIAGQGLVESERRATDIARRIVSSSAREASFTPNTTDTAAGVPNRAAIETDIAQNTGQPIGFGSSSFIQDIVALQTEQRVFDANAATFRAIDETADELGRLLDDDA